jgi:enamine deaminase RidA (YjgF/YER057c/UK114 family)
MDEPKGHLSQPVRIRRACVSEPLVAAAGQVGVEPATGNMSSDVGDQTRQALANVAAVLEASGASLDDVIRVGVFLTDPDDFAAMTPYTSGSFRDPIRRGPPSTWACPQT